MKGRPFRRKPCRSFLKLFTGWKIPETRKSGGSGLGLYIVRMILDAHGAAYGAENTAGGVRFWFRLKRKSHRIHTKAP